MVSVSLMMIVLASPALLLGSQRQDDPPNAFAGFETYFLSNGVKVWYKHLPDDPDVALSVTVPYGSDLDPEGKEQLAHFTEHMLFSDHLGRTE